MLCNFGSTRFSLTKSWSKGVVGHDTSGESKQGRRDRFVLKVTEELENKITWLLGKEITI